MLSFCLKCKENTESINSRVSKTTTNKTMLLSKFVVCGSKMSIFVKKQEVNGLSSSLGLKTKLIKITSLLDILF